MPADLHAIENALYTWLNTATDVPVIWSGQRNLHQPEGDYCSLTWIDPDHRVGAFDAVYARSREGSPPAGEEIELHVLAEREASLLVQAYSDDSLGPTSAWQRLRTARLALGKPSVAAAFEAAGFAVIDAADLQVVPVIVDDDWEGRATFRLRIRYRDGVSEFVTYIQKVNLVPPGS